MALLSRKVDYALLALSYLYHRAEGGSAREISERFALRRAFLANVLKVLCRKGFVRGQRGGHGGYVLQRPAAEICLCDLLDALDEPFHLAECNRLTASASAGAEQNCAMQEVCPVRGAIAEVDRRLREVLRAVTLADLFRAPEAREAGACAQAPAGEEAGDTQFGLDLGVRERLAAR
jgi:Rrf2 family protein